ncbi:MAG: hypothetical protein DRQ02_02640 [Candidatus Latescibacterota bacterium]|nr:MAG: hypothetical protein DRQ02_02640 [Candidatus Latescibacterota bacterium]
MDEIIIIHDLDTGPHYPVRNFRCSCGLVHRFRRAWVAIPESPLCCSKMARDWNIDGFQFQMTTPIREVRHKLRQEEREGKRPRAIERDMNPHIATV